MNLCRPKHRLLGCCFGTLKNQNRLCWRTSSFKICRFVVHGSRSTKQSQRTIRAEGASRTGKVNTKKGEDEENLEHDLIDGQLAILMLILGTPYACIASDGNLAPIWDLYGRRNSSMNELSYTWINTLSNVVNPVKYSRSMNFRHYLSIKKRESEQRQIWKHDLKVRQ